MSNSNGPQIGKPPRACPLIDGDYLFKLTYCFAVYKIHALGAIALADSENAVKLFSANCQGLFLGVAKVFIGEHLIEGDERSLVKFSHICAYTVLAVVFLTQHCLFSIASLL